MATIKLGNTTPNGIYVGSTQVRSIYLGSTLVWGSSAPVESLQLSPSSFSSGYSAAGGSKSITVTCTGTWSVSADQNWISFSRSTGTSGQSTAVICDVNDSWSPRTGTVTFSSGLLTQTVSVYQEGKEAVITLNPTTITVPSTSSYSTQFSITANCDWDISSTPWITVSGSSTGSGNSSNIQVTIAANTGDARTGYIYVTEDEGRTQAEITVTQPGVVTQPTITVSAINWHNGYDGNDDPVWLNKQSWQIEFVGGNTSKTYTNIEILIMDDSGNDIQVLDTSHTTLTIGANQTVYLGLNASDFASSTNAQLSLDGYTVDYDEYVLVIRGDNIYEDAPFVQTDIND